MNAILAPPPLCELPLWRLVVALHDAEEVAGTESESAALVRQAIIDRLSGPAPQPRPSKGGVRRA